MRGLLTGLLLLGTVLLPAGETPGDSWLLTKEDIIFEGEAPEDFFALSLNLVDLQGTFDEDVWAAGRKVQFGGTAGDDLRVYAAEVLNSDGLVKGNLQAIASVGNILLNTNSVVMGRAELQAGKRITVRGRVEGDLWVEAPSVLIEAEVLGSLTLRAKEIQLMPGTVIHGDLLNRNPQSIPLPAGVEVLGERKQISDNPGQLEQNLQTWKWMLKGLQFLSAYLIGLMLLRTFPRFTGQNVDLLLHHRNPSLSIGLFAFLLFGISGYFLLFSILGSGVGIFLLVVTALLFYLGKIMVAYCIGLMILRQKTDLSFGKLALALFIGLLVLYTAYTLDYIGGAFYLMSSCWGMGAMLISLRNSQKVLKIEVPPSLKNPQG